jgi:RNA polymerase sigma factor (sigma-70 family)
VDGSAPPAVSSAAISASGESLFRRYDHWLRTVLSKRYGRELADDVAAETYLRAAPEAAAGRVRNPKAFLLQIAHNLIVDRLRKDRVGSLSEPFDDDAFAPRSNQASQDEALTLKQILLALPPELRDVFFLNHIEGQTYQEIAVILAIPVTTVHHRMRKALERVAAAMRD